MLLTVVVMSRKLEHCQHKLRGCLFVAARSSAGSGQVGGMAGWCRQGGDTGEGCCGPGGAFKFRGSRIEEHRVWAGTGRSCSEHTCKWLRGMCVPWEWSHGINLAKGLDILLQLQSCATVFV